MAECFSNENNFSDIEKRKQSELSIWEYQTLCSHQVYIEMLP